MRSNIMAEGASPSRNFWSASVALSDASTVHPAFPNFIWYIDSKNLSSSTMRIVCFALVSIKLSISEFIHLLPWDFFSECLDDCVFFHCEHSLRARDFGDFSFRWTRENYMLKHLIHFNHLKNSGSSFNAARAILSRLNKKH